jgi:hypothetical protein
MERLYDSMVGGGLGYGMVAVLLRYGGTRIARVDADGWSRESKGWQ